MSELADYDLPAFPHLNSELLASGLLRGGNASKGHHNGLDELDPSLLAEALSFDANLSTILDKDQGSLTNHHSELLPSFDGCEPRSERPSQLQSSTVVHSHTEVPRTNSASFVDHDGNQNTHAVGNKRNNPDANDGMLQVGDIPWMQQQVEIHSRTGHAQCLCTRGKFIAIGITSGMALIFDSHSHSLLHIIEAPNVNTGPITSMQFSPATDLLICGFSSGALAIIDTDKGTMLRLYDDAHQDTLTHIEFTDERVFISADSRGRILWNTVSKVLLVLSISSAVVHERAAFLDEVVAVAAPPPAATDLMRGMPQLLALCSTKVAFVVILKPLAKVVLKLTPPLSCPQRALPHVAWQPLLNDSNGSSNYSQQATNSHALPYTLAIGWGAEVRLFRANVGQSGKREFVAAGGFAKEGDAYVCTMQWLQARMLVVVSPCVDFWCFFVLHVCVCMHVYVCMCVYIYVCCTHTHTHTDSARFVFCSC